MTRAKVTIPYLFEKKAQKEPITMLTCYDYPMALLEEKAEIDIILCGDSLGMTVYGYNGTLPVTMDMMVVHAAAVTRGAPTAFVIGDMPYMSYQISDESAIANAGRFIQEAGADCVKLEGGGWLVETVRQLSRNGIPVCAHLGLLPQSVHKLGGYKVQGREEAAARQIIDEALALQDAGADVALVECNPAELAARLTEALEIPLIGIGAGPHCDAQVLVSYDMLGITPGRRPKFSKNFLTGRDSLQAAVEAYVAAVKSGEFPGPEHCIA